MSQLSKKVIKQRIAELWVYEKSETENHGDDDEEPLVLSGCRIKKYLVLFHKATLIYRPHAEMIYKNTKVRWAHYE